MKWFKHDSDANQDAKLQNVLLDYGLEGYGLYWYCIELIVGKIDQENLTFELEHDARIIARNTGSTPQKVEEMMRYFVKLGLFEDSAGTISCLKLIKRLDKSMTTNPKIRELLTAVREKNKDDSGYVYFLRVNYENPYENPSKLRIGKSKNPTARANELSKKLGSSANVEVVYKVASEECTNLESEINQRFKKESIDDGWFTDDGDLCNFIEELRHDVKPLRHDVVSLRDDYDMQDKIRLDKKRKDLKEKYKKERLLDYSLWPELPSDQVFDDWCAMRKRMKADVTQTVVNTFGRELQKAFNSGVSVESCISECVTRNWRGFKADWILKGNLDGMSLAQRNMENFKA